MSARSEPKAAGFDPTAVVVGAAVALLAGLAVSVAMAAVVYFTTATEAGLEGALYYAGLLAIVLGGAVSARRARNLGWLHGGFVGILATTAALLLTAMLFPGSLTATEVTRQLILSFLAGCLGGVVGVNL